MGSLGTTGAWSIFGTGGRAEPRWNQAPVQPVPPWKTGAQQGFPVPAESDAPLLGCKLKASLCKPAEHKEVCNLGSSARRQVRAQLNVPPPPFPPPDRVRLPGNLPPEPGKPTLLLFPTCYCAVQIFALESAALPRAPQPRPALAARTRHQGRILPTWKTGLYIEGKAPSQSWNRALEMLRRDLGPF